MTPPPVPGPEVGLNAAVAAELRAELARRRLSVQALSELADVPYGTLRRYLAAERHIDVATLEQIAQALDFDLVNLIRAAKVRVDPVAVELLEQAARNPGRPPSNRENDDE